MRETRHHKLCATYIQMYGRFELPTLAECALDVTKSTTIHVMASSIGSIMLKFVALNWRCLHGNLDGGGVEIIFETSYCFLLLLYVTPYACRGDPCATSTLVSGTIHYCNE